MEIIKTHISGLLVLEPTVFTDERGYFMETFREEWLPDIHFVQENESLSTKGVLRGLHYQVVPYPQAKLVRCIKGKILDVAVDLRKSSPTFGQHYKIELSEENKKQLFIPRGFAHGFLTLEDSTIVSYKVDNNYSKESETCILFDDKDLAIDWGVDKESLILSEKDKKGTHFSQAKLFE